MCISPFMRKTNDGPYVSVPCGKCYKCKARRVSAWSFRLVQEDKHAMYSSYFITLTYGTGTDKDGHNYPRKSANNFNNLSKADLQLFFKRLRYYSAQLYRKEQLYSRREKRVYNLIPPLLRYYAVGEYGGERKRPHYHIILFNSHIDAIEKAWTMGNIYYGGVSGASIGYTLKYISKDKTVGNYSRDDRQQEFSVMSKGLGAAYVTPNIIAWHNADLLNRIYCMYEGGKKMSMPRYYKDRIYHMQDRNLIKMYYEANFMNDTERYKVDENGVLRFADFNSTEKYIRQEYMLKKQQLQSLKNQNLYEIEQF